MTVSSVLKKSFIEKPFSFYSIHAAEKVKWGSLEAGERSLGRASYRQDRETASLPEEILMPARFGFSGGEAFGRRDDRGPGANLVAASTIIIQMTAGFPFGYRL